MGAQGHHIVKFKFDLRLNVEADAIRLQKDLSSHFYKVIQPALAKFLDDLIPETEQVRIDRLEIDLGNLNLAGVTSDEILARILKSLREQIHPALQSPFAPLSIERATLPQGAVENWLFFLETGQLPWPPEVSADEWNKQILEGLIRHSALPGKLVALLKKSSTACRRLIQQYSDQFLVHLIEIFTGHSQAGLETAWENILENSTGQIRDGRIDQSIDMQESTSRITEPFKRRRAFRHWFWEQILQRTIIEGRRESMTELMENMIRNINQSERPGHVRHSPGKNGSHASDNAETENTSVSSENSESPEKAHGLKEWYLQHAGIILLHPFLAQFFGNTGLVKNGKFRDAEAKTAAVHLLNYLVTGECGMPEYALLLPKVLCGIPLEMPVPAEVDLEEDWLNEADHLLEAVVEQWEALGSVSAGSLREGFLERPGKLTHTGNGWLLQVEQQTLDVLLDRLPWGLSVIKLPWMKEMMKVEWR